MNLIHNFSQYSLSGAKIRCHSCLQCCSLSFGSSLFVAVQFIDNYINSKGSRPFPKLIIFQTSLFCFNSRKHENWKHVTYPKKSKLYFKQFFEVIIHIFDLKCHGYTSLKVAFEMFGLAFMKFRISKSLHQENKKFDHDKNLRIFFV